jgi:ABC-type transporter Mla subunit MlaD
MSKTIEIEVKVDSKQAVKGVDELDKSVDELGKSTKKTTETTGELSQGMTGLGGAFGGAIAGAKALGKQFLALALNPIGLVIAAIAVALLAVKTAFTSSEKGQNKYNKLMTVLGSILNNLLDVLANVGEAIIDTFENPRAALDSFVKAIKDNLINRFEGLLELIPQLGQAISALFSGEFSKAGEIAVNAVAKVTLGVEDLTCKIQAATEATIEFIAEAEREARIAAGIADRRARADKIERALITERAEADRKIIELRDKAARRDFFTS